MGFELGVDYFDEFEIGRDNSIVISWDYYNDRYKPLYFKSVDIAESYLKDHIVFLSNKTDDAQALMAIKGCCIAAITQTIKVDYVITSVKNNDK